MTLRQPGHKGGAVVKQDPLRLIESDNHIQLAIAVHVGKGNGDRNQVTALHRQSRNHVEVRMQAVRISLGQFNHLDAAIEVDRDKVAERIVAIAMTDIGISLIGARIAIHPIITPALQGWRDQHVASHEDRRDEHADTQREYRVFPPARWWRCPPCLFSSLSDYNGGIKRHIVAPGAGGYPRRCIGVLVGFLLFVVLLIGHILLSRRMLVLELRPCGRGKILKVQVGVMASSMMRGDGGSPLLGGGLRETGTPGSGEMVFCSLFSHLLVGFPEFFGEKKLEDYLICSS